MSSESLFAGSALGAEEAPLAGLTKLAEGASGPTRRFSKGSVVAVGSKVRVWPLPDGSEAPSGSAERLSWWMEGAMMSGGIVPGGVYEVTEASDPSFVQAIQVQTPIYRWWVDKRVCELVEESEGEDWDDDEVDDDDDDEYPAGFDEDGPWCPNCGAALNSVGCSARYDTRGYEIWSRVQFDYDGYVTDSGDLDESYITDNELDEYTCGSCGSTFSTPETDEDEAVVAYLEYNA